MNISESWKNRTVFEKQLDLNLKELNGTYPSHWMVFLKFLDYLKDKDIKTLLDVGCGAGTYSELCKKHFPYIQYTGTDYSQDAIDIASKQWPGSKFYCKDYKELTYEDLKDIDILHACSLHNVLPNGDECLEFLLKLKPKYLILGKVHLTVKASFSTTYTADTITTYLYRHNYNNLYKLFRENGYFAKEIRANNYTSFLLIRKE